jgi:hypothetical protein
MPYCHQPESVLISSVHQFFSQFTDAGLAIVVEEICFTHFGVCGVSQYIIVQASGFQFLTEQLLQPSK